MFTFNLKNLIEHEIIKIARKCLKTKTNFYHEFRKCIESVSGGEDKILAINLYNNNFKQFEKTALHFLRIQLLKECPNDELVEIIRRQEEKLKQT